MSPRGGLRWNMRLGLVVIGSNLTKTSIFSLDRSIDDKSVVTDKLHGTERVSSTILGKYLVQ